MELCRECAEKVAATAAAQTRDSHGRTPANIRHWMESSGDVRGPVQVFECVWKGEGIIKHRKRVELSSRHVGVLRERFERHGPGGASEADFHLRLFNMLLRYETLFFLDQGTQGALPPRVFQLLQTHFGIEHECFASQATTTLSPWHVGICPLAGGHSQSDGGCGQAAQRVHDIFDIQFALRRRRLSLRIGRIVLRHLPNQRLLRGGRAPLQPAWSAGSVPVCECSTRCA